MIDARSGGTAQRDTALPGQGGEALQRIGEQVGERSWFQLQVETACIELRNLEQVVHQPRELIDLFLCLAEILLDGLRIANDTI